MLTIRTAQMAAFERERRANFERRLVDHLRPLFAKQSAETDAEQPDAEHMEKQVGLGVASGLRFFETEKDVARYCEIVMTRLGGWNGVDHPREVFQILLSKTVEAARRLDNFERWLAQRKR